MMEMSSSDYEQEFECSFEASLQGAYYKDEFAAIVREGRIRDVPYQSDQFVNTYWDLGINDNMAVWFVQFSGKEVHLIDHMEENGQSIEWWVKQIKDKPYKYDEHYIPHDGAARELGTGQTRQDTFLKYGLRTNVVPRQNVADGIDAVRTSLGVTALRNYKKQFNGKKNIYEDKPVHDWASDSSDAFRQLALTYNPARIGRDTNNLPRSFDTSLDW